MTVPEGDWTTAHWKRLLTRRTATLLARAERAEAETADLRQAITEYISEVENPAPDYTMRRILRDRLKALVTGEREGTDG